VFTATKRTTSTTSGLSRQGFWGQGRKQSSLSGFWVWLSATEKAEVVWFCRDLDGNVHLWAYDGCSEQIAAKDYRRGKIPRKFPDSFHRMHRQSR
jgi:hypothetical protein